MFAETHQENHSHIPDYESRIANFGPFRLQHTATFEESLDSLFCQDTQQRSRCPGTCACNLRVD